MSQHSGDPLAYCVFRFEVFIGRDRDGFGSGEPLCLPVQTAVDCPLEDARPFGLQLIGEIEIAFLGGDTDQEWDEVQPAPDSFIDVADPGLVVACDEQLELR